MPSNNSKDVLFEKVTDGFIRALFLTREITGASGSAHIETEHLLAGIIRADSGLFESFFPGQLKNIETSLEMFIADKYAGKQPIPDDAELPLSEECKRILRKHAPWEARNAERMSINHLMLGFLHEPGCVAVTGFRNVGLEPAELRFRFTEVTRPSTIKLEIDPTKRNRDLI